VLGAVRRERERERERKEMALKRQWAANICGRGRDAHMVGQGSRMAKSQELPILCLAHVRPTLPKMVTPSVH
jgi:hypothetical protein